MNLSNLKRIRVFVSLLFFLALVVLFLDIKTIIHHSVFEPFLFFQFIPSLLSFLVSFSFLSLGFLVIIVWTLLFGRVYCSTICPLGTLQDIISRIANKFKKRKRYLFTSGKTKTRFIILFLVFIPLVLGYSLFLSILEPYSIFGRITVLTLQNAMVFSNNFVSSVLTQNSIYWLLPITGKPLVLHSLVLALGLLVLIIMASAFRGRLYCNLICPVGTLLGVISKFAIFKIRLDLEKCKSCTVCEWVCKAECINSKDKRIDNSRCVMCFNCLSVCSGNGVILTAKRQKDKSEEVNIDKREFLSKTMLFAFSSLTFGFTPKDSSLFKDTKIPEKRTRAVMPPGAENWDKFHLACTSCNLCISKCPTNVLEPAYLEYGLLNIFHPRMNFIKSFCNFECNICTEVCPTGALKPFELSEKKLLQIGKVKLIKENCVVFVKETDCGACSEHCPTKAVDMVPYKKIRAPEIKEEYCIGCGACEKACPTIPYKSIYVVGNYNQVKAKPNIIEKIDFEYKDDFPF